MLLKLLKEIGKVIKIDVDSDEVSKRRFARICVEVDTTKPPKMELNYKGVILLNLHLLIMEIYKYLLWL